MIDDFKNKSIINHDFPLNYYAKFKVYKVFSYKIYKINPSKELILEHNITKNLTAEDITRGRIEADKEYLEVLIKWLNNK